MLSAPNGYGHNNQVNDVDQGGQSWIMAVDGGGRFGASRNSSSFFQNTSCAVGTPTESERRFFSAIGPESSIEIGSAMC
jgi:hypothetical protein